jgi:uncharacterized protein
MRPINPTALALRLSIWAPRATSRGGFPLVALGLVVATAAVGLHASQSVRVVDSVVVSQAGDEAEHHFAGADTATDKSAGRPWRSATGWFGYSLRIYDDSPLTIVLVLADGDAAGEAFDVLVDGAKTARVTREAGKTKGATIEVKLALGDTKGKTSVVVKLAAVPGSKTGRLLEIRTMQEHLE